MTYLLDTCVLSELIKPVPEPLVTHWIAEQTESSFYISALTIGELTHGIHRLPKSEKRLRLEEWMQNELLLRFKDKIIAIDNTIALKWGVILAEAGSRGRVLPTVDSLLAATAQECSLTLVTRNIKDFQGLHIKIFNPWHA